jgi:hypothetical protein
MTPEQLAPLIKEQIALGDLAGDELRSKWVQHNRKLGELLWAAREQMTEPAFKALLKQFGLKRRDVRLSWMP